MSTFKFKVGDRVVARGATFTVSGRPKVRIIEKAFIKNGKPVYSGSLWMASEESLILESDFKWPSDLEMRIMDRKAKDDFELTLKVFSKKK